MTMLTNSKKPIPLERSVSAGTSDGFEGPKDFETRLTRTWKGSDCQSWIDEFQFIFGTVKGWLLLLKWRRCHDWSYPNMSFALTNPTSRTTKPKQNLIDSTTNGLFSQVFW